MPQIAYRANLSSSVFPMTLAEADRAVIIPGPDQNYDRRVDPTGEQKNAGIPQAIFLQDVMPTANGYQSVGYKTVAPPPPNQIPGDPQPVPYFVQDFYFGQGPDTKIIAGVFRGFAGYVDVACTLKATAGLAWVYATGTIPTSTSRIVAPSAAQVRGTNYYFDGFMLFEVTNPSGAVLNFADVSGTVTGLVLADVASICSCANYLIALQFDGTVAWSSTTTPTDFTASLVSGAGEIVPSDLQGAVRFLTEASAGFYIYTSKNVIGARYTGNARYPFKFQAIADCGTYSYPSQVSSDRGRNLQYGVDNAKRMFRFSVDGVEILAPEFSTFLERQSKYDLFDYTNNTFSLIDLTISGPLLERLQLDLYLDRYLMVSVGIYKYVYDLLLQRYGRLREEGFLLTNSTEGAMFFLATATTKQMSFDIYNNDFIFRGVLALGRFQYVRSRKIKLEEIEFEGPPNAAAGVVPDTDCIVLPCQDGRNFDAPVVPYTASDTSGGLAHYLCHHTAQNHTILLKGAFAVNTLQLKFTPAGGN